MKRIKSIKNIILLGYLIIGFTSCDFLDRSDPDKLNKNDFYKTENDMYQALNAAYDGLKTNYYNNMYYLDRNQIRQYDFGIQNSQFGHIQ
ncbi:hypothetical protein NXV73_09465 [Bacteroides salyersiae]|nr:hypothetical protein [Bacteroides salyersiae]